MNYFKNITMIIIFVFSFLNCGIATLSNARTAKENEHRFKFYMGSLLLARQAEPISPGNLEYNFIWAFPDIDMDIEFRTAIIGYGLGVKKMIINSGLPTSLRISGNVGGVPHLRYTAVNLDLISNICESSSIQYVGLKFSWLRESYPVQTVDPQGNEAIIGVNNNQRLIGMFYGISFKKYTFEAGIHFDVPYDNISNLTFAMPHFGVAYKI